MSKQEIISTKKSYTFDCFAEDRVGKNRTFVTASDDLRAGCDEAIKALQEIAPTAIKKLASTRLVKIVEGVEKVEKTMECSARGELGDYARVTIRPHGMR